MEAKDNTMKILKNCLKNLKYIKMMVWENYYYQKISQRRNVELKCLRKGYMFFLIWVLISWNIPLISMITMLVVLFGNGGVLDVASFNAFLKIFMMLGMGMFGIPYAIQTMIDISISIGRINKFLASEELD